MNITRTPARFVTEGSRILIRTVTQGCEVETEQVMKVLRIEACRYSPEKLVFILDPLSGKPAEEHKVHKDESCNVIICP